MKNKKLMKNRLTYFVLGLVLFLSQSIVAQSTMGGWRTHFSYNNVVQIAQSENKIFAVSDGKLFAVDKRDGNLEKFTKVNGMNGNDIAQIAYSDADKVLVIAYSDGNIDFLSDAGIINLPDFKNKQINVNKSTNAIAFSNGKAFLSCNFGLLVINLKKREIKDTYYIGENGTEVKILNTTFFNNNIYASTESKIYYAPENERNLIDYAYWNQLPNLPGSGKISSIYGLGDYLILLRNKRMYKYTLSTSLWSALEPSLSVRQMNVTNGKLFVASTTGTFIFDNALTKSSFSSALNFTYGNYDTATQKWWFAAEKQGVGIFYVKDGKSKIDYYQPNGPLSNMPYTLKFGGEKLFMLPGGRWEVQYNRPGIVMMYEDDMWRNISNGDIVSKAGASATDFCDIAIDPNDNKHFLISSYGRGVYEFRNDELENWYKEDNSTLETAVSGDDQYLRIIGGEFDAEGNVWFGNIAVNKQIKIKLSNGNWTELRYNILDAKYTLGQIISSKKNPNQKWFNGVRAGVGIGIFDTNGTITDQSDDKEKFYSSFSDEDTGDNFSPANYYCMTQDNDGVIWAGTDLGPILFNNTENAFNEGYNCSRIKIPRNDGSGLADYLLSTEAITAIAIDGANRKWIGTKRSGVYLMSADGQETIKHFSADNSPLLSNDIMSIAIHPTTGEVFIGTGQGLVSYYSDAATAESKFRNVHVYPNPVRENYEGVITITGLVKNTNVKITDVAGNLIYETTSNGSLATWDGNNIYGRRVNTGVYVAICSSEDGTETAQTKILIVN